VFTQLHFCVSKNFTHKTICYFRAVKFVIPTRQHFCFSCHPERSSLLDNSAGTVVKYAYDAFGNCKVLLDTAGLHLATEVKFMGNTLEDHINNIFDWLIFWD
jgi:hypothetical protein